MNHAVHVFSSFGVVAMLLLDAHSAVLAQNPGATIPLPVG